MTPRSLAASISTAALLLATAPHAVAEAAATPIHDREQIPEQERSRERERALQAEEVRIACREARRSSTEPQAGERRGESPNVAAPGDSEAENPTTARGRPPVSEEAIERHRQAMRALCGLE